MSKLAQLLIRLSAKALSNDNKISNVMDAIKAHNDIDTFILNENYFSTNLIQSRPELMTFVFTRKKRADSMQMCFQQA